MSSISISSWDYPILLIDLVIIITLLICMKFLKGYLSNVKAQEELKDKNNAAFGISYAGGILALGIMLTGVSSGEFADTYLAEAISMSGFGLLGILLILLGRKIQDLFVLKHLDIHSELAKNNIAAALVDVGHMLAVALIVRSAFIWMPHSDWSLIPILLGSFVLSQIILLLASIYRVKLFKLRNEGNNNCLQTAIAQGNAALALRYGAFIASVALVVTASQYIVSYNIGAPWQSLLIWSGISFIAIVLFALTAILIRKIILMGIDVAEEVDQQKNIGVAAIESALFWMLGLILIALLS